MVHSGLVVSIEARPEPMSLDAISTAVIVVDMQNDFGADGGMFQRAGIPIESIKAVVEPTAGVLAAARMAGIQIIYLKMEFAADLSNTGGPDAPNHIKHRMLGVGDSIAAPDGTDSRILVRDTWNTEILPELAPEPGDILVSKHRYSGFFQTDLDAILRDRAITTLVFTGCTTSVCVDATLRDAFYRDYRCLLLTDCTAEPLGSQFSRGNHDATVLTVETLFGWVTDSSALLRALTIHPVTAAV
ncbi:MAG TPA: cysteine hydrolase [Thermomicrobiales bacterium]|nr:cysteine hydrolase [Thermomicrobiales bacterium]